MAHTNEPVSLFLKKAHGFLLRIYLTHDNLVVSSHSLSILVRKHHHHLFFELSENLISLFQVESIKYLHFDHKAKSVGDLRAGDKALNVVGHPRPALGVQHVKLPYI